MTPTLIVVDMQPEFDAALYPDVVVGVTLEIQAAVARKSAIVFVEYEDAGDTHRSLFKLAKGYRKKAQIIKYEDDGSSQIVRTIRRRDFDETHLRVCGVNTNACVQCTVDGLLRRLPDAKIEVVKEACGTCSYGRYDWRKFTKHKNLKLV